MGVNVVFLSTPLRILLYLTGAGRVSVSLVGERYLVLRGFAISILRYPYHAHIVSLRGKVLPCHMVYLTTQASQTLCESSACLLSWQKEEPKKCLCVSCPSSEFSNFSQQYLRVHNDLLDLKSDAIHVPLRLSN